MVNVTTLTKLLTTMNELTNKLEEAGIKNDKESINILRADIFDIHNKIKKEIEKEDV
jgi:hypothetical protein